MTLDSPDPTGFLPSLSGRPCSRDGSERAYELAQLAQYRIVKQLGSGGMGVVYQAEDMQLNRLAALKVMRTDYASDQEARSRFQREARAAAALKHDHIVTIYQVGEENGVLFLAMEFLSGKSLEEWLRPDRRATVAETLLIGKQIARGLAAAHAAGLVHRDIKPANLWLEAPRGRVKILDFGLARHTGGEFSALTQDGSVLGTPAFMAPEQARGDIVDQRCDLFSLGCVLYRMLTGRLPFQGTTTYAVLTAIASEMPVPAARIRQEIPQRLSNLVDRLLAKKPEDRFASAQAVFQELLVIEQEGKQPPPPPALHMSPVVTTSTRDSAYLPKKWPSLSWHYALVALAVGLAIMVGAVMVRVPINEVPQATHNTALRVNEPSERFAAAESTANLEDAQTIRPEGPPLAAPPPPVPPPEDEDASIERERPTIQTGDSVKINYVLVVDGRKVDSTTDGQPLQFVVGSRQVIIGLEEQLIGLHVADTKSITVYPDKAYGPIRPEAIQKVPKANFRASDSLKEGTMVTARGNGNSLQARIVEVGEDIVTLDLNHPLAGKTLNFEIEVVSIQKATAQALKSEP